MKSIRLDEWAITMLNQTIRADAEFQINQRNAWLEFEKSTAVFNGIDLAAGFQHQRNLFMDEVTFELDLVPDIPGFFDRTINAVLFRKAPRGVYYRLKKPEEQHPGALHVRLVVKRNIDNRYQSEVTLDPKDKGKPEQIQVRGIS
jgi:hypothetical protein